MPAYDVVRELACGECISETEACCMRKECVMSDAKCGNGSNHTGNIKWRRQWICLRRSFREVCRTICRLSDCMCGKGRF